MVKYKGIAAWIIASMLTALFLFSASGKLFLHPEQMAQMKLANWTIIIALGEITSALLLLFRKTMFTEPCYLVPIWEEQLLFT